MIYIRTIAFDMERHIVAYIDSAARELEVSRSATIRYILGLGYLDRSKAINPSNYRGGGVPGRDGHRGDM